LEGEVRAIKKERDELLGFLANRKKQIDAQEKELTLLKQSRNKSDARDGDLKKELESTRGDLNEAKKKVDELAKYLASHKKRAEQAVAKLEDASQENQLILLQLSQLQEELQTSDEERARFEKLYTAYKSRWGRLESRHPNYVDFGGVELASFDNLSEVPSITWRVRDYTQAGVAFDEFYFQTVLQQGCAGLRILQGPTETPSEDDAVVPQLLAGSPKQLERFVRIGTTEYKQMTAAVSILSQLESTQWQGFELPPQFDLSFWRPSLLQLASQFQSLPPMLRYNEVKLKRELINADYEHLWLEFYGLSIANVYLNKFEARLGASLVQPDGFSVFPKFEIPLIDGRLKPFESWYPESQDESGAKLELRFSLEKNIFDTKVWAELGDPDKLFMMRLVYAFPEALRRLEAMHTPIQRSWDTWVEFASAATKVLESNLQPAKATAVAATTASTNATATTATTATTTTTATSSTTPATKQPPASSPTVAPVTTRTPLVQGLQPRAAAVPASAKGAPQVIQVSHKKNSAPKRAPPKLVGAWVSKASSKEK